MNAKKASRIRTDKRTPLQEVIPLDTPFHIFVDPSAACNFNCKFCFNRNKKNTFHKIMEYDLFVKIVNDIKNFPQKLKVLRLYKEGEPLLNKRLPDMIYYAKKNEVAETIDFTTNGSLLNPDKNFSLINAGVDAINISVEGLSSRKYFEVSGVKIDFNNYVDNIKHLYKNRGNCRILIKANDVNVSEEEQDKFYEVFGEICDEIALEKVVPIWHNVDISDVKSDFDKGIYNQKISDVEVCPFIFYSFTINSDGTVSSCFMDWEHLNIIGNVKEESVYDIWNGENLKKLRICHLENDRKRYEVCKNCKQLTFATIDNIDFYRNEILNKIKNVKK
ncbi:TPA: radical SAM/SPASM domain-containing protein [Clostridium sporogenes]